MKQKFPISIQYLILAFCFLFSCKEDLVLEEFQIEPGFSLDRVAAEPLIKDPVDLEFNELGDALVLEMPGYPFEDQQSRILVLKDRNKDGVYDDRIVFIENLQLANSFMPYKKGVLVAAPPYLLFVRDENQDYIPEKVDTLMGGFSTGNLQHNYNALTFGLDNWIYAANGGNDGKPFWWGEPDSQLDLRGQDFRFNLETKTLERLGESSGGFGLAMDDFGRVFETHNLEHISQLVFPDRYKNGHQILKNHTLHNISNHEENGLARIFPIGEQESRVNHPEQSGYFSGACGITYYGGGSLGVEYENTIWVADVVLNLIHVDKIQSNGSAFIASRALENRDFLASSDRSFRPVNMNLGPDGSMYVVDMYRKVIEHPEWIPDEIEKTLDLEAGKDQGRIYKITKKDVNIPFDLDQFKSQKGLVKSLNHSNQWVRKTAHRLLIDQVLTDETIKELNRNLVTGNDFAKLHALWILGTKKKFKEGALLGALQDPSRDIRENALLVAEQELDAHPDILAAVLASLGDPDNRVRMQAALSISTLGIERLSELKQEVMVGVQNAITLPYDDWNIAAYTLATGPFAPELLSTLLVSPSIQIPEQFLSSLALNAGKDGNDAKSILQALNNSDVQMSVKQQIIRQFSFGLDEKSGSALEPYILALEQSGDPGLISELAQLRSKLHLNTSPEFLQLSQAALRKVNDKSMSESFRLQQLSLIELLPYEVKSDVLFQCLSNTEPLKLQENALRQLSKYNEQEIGKKIVDIWNELSPQTRRYASDLLLYVETHHDALLTGLENGQINIGEMNFDLERRRTLLWWTDNEETKRRAEKLFTDSGVSNRKEAIDQMKPALALNGSVLDGANVFENICANCHIFGKTGNEVGPALTEIGRKSKETNLHDILDPNAGVDTKYINHRLETNDGVVHLGIVSNETDENITIKKPGGESVTIYKSNIKEFRSLGTSLMMEGLENSMTHQEMADLLAFLQSGVE
ncbi:PVC-type heme-binding CxxCH protein [Algoriphagus halophilus]|uniref:Putative membrane-bound dehydrogenase domain-containing protein n=1 Tax=Algoriphagus halophilus TaxID=226505 RepID=A0A1N6DUU0_9BACT|nr:PVC-type heme-binding CxxCH protein [Algoriphagus halophilus]SIN74477.1 putative membrane-bound dehydrogenase domain-containing protein [Algoriphagus halophilus]